MDEVLVSTCRILDYSSTSILMSFRVQVGSLKVFFLRQRVNRTKIEGEQKKTRDSEKKKKRDPPPKKNISSMRVKDKCTLKQIQ